MRKLIYIAIFITMLVPSGRAGQDPLYSQFMTNPFLINPGITGTYNHYRIITNNRIQWIGMANAPITNTISMYGPMISQPMGIGAFIVNDVAGAESRTSINATYAYNYGISEDLKVSMGLMVGFFQHKIDGGKLRIEDKGDPVFTEGEVYQNYKPDATVGGYLYSSMYNVGISVTNLFGNKLTFEEPDKSDTTAPGQSTISRLKQHVYLHGGYKYPIIPELSIEPAFVIRKVTATPLQIDFNVRCWYGRRSWNGNKFWGGLSFRYQDAVNVLIGVVYQNKIEVGYSYDIGINRLRSYHTGSHELMVIFRFNDIKEY